MNITAAIAQLQKVGYGRGTFKAHEDGLFMSWSTGFGGRGDSLDIDAPTATPDKVTVTLYWQDNRLNEVPQPEPVVVADFDSAVSYALGQIKEWHAKQPDIDDL